ncbi:MAG: metal-sensing transcriptional repressor [Erysipelotrichaceae bacterium]|nr:metal-sensing transcriptional repressor [Erysipelotrichaceae bacterium]MDY5252016.1 metal-sensing transcriptional repressor [Erysipelotrichaceae bacterium]
MKNKEAYILLKTAQGQLNSAIKMIEDQRYCIDISNQLLATSALINKANKKILQNHLFTCVKTSANNDDIDPKLDEIAKVLDKIIK